MKKIINWTFGACFRTIGRFLAIFIVCILLLFIGSKIGLKFPKNIFMKVNAEELVVPVNFVREEHHNINYNDSPGFTQSTTNSLIAHRLIYSTTDEQIKEYHITFDTTNKNYSNITYIEIPFTFSKNLISSTIDDNEAYFCEEWTFDNETNTYTCTQKLQYYNSVLKEVDGSNISINNFYIQMVYSDDTWNTCSLNNSNNIICNVNGKVPKQLYFYINFKTIKPTNFLLAISRAFRLYSSSTQEQIDAINNANNSINDVKDSINNSNVDESSSTAGGFFDNFSDNDHGLSSIITSPLRAINAMLSNQCVAPGATYKGQSFSLPCGSMLWDRPGGNDFKNFINIFYGGFLAYYVIRRLFLDIEKLKNPNNDKVEVEKL